MTTAITSDSFYTFPAAAASSAATAAAKNSDIMGKEDFLTLLVAQLQNQDPLNPDDPTEFTAQLAQFSSLEQLTNLNKSMTALTTAQINSEKFSALNLIGKDVSYNGSAFSYDGAPISVGYQLDGTAAGVTLSIQDSEGKTVKTLQPSTSSELAAGNHFLTWDGTDQNGAPVPAGTYKIVLQASAAGTDSSIAAAPLISSKVTGVDLSTGMLTTNAGEVLLNNLIRVAQPADSVLTNTLATSDSTSATTGTVAALSADTTASTDDGQTAQDVINTYLQLIQP